MEFFFFPDLPSCWGSLALWRWCTWGAVCLAVVTVCLTLLVSTPFQSRTTITTSTGFPMLTVSTKYALVACLIGVTLDWPWSCSTLVQRLTNEVCSVGITSSQWNCDPEFCCRDHFVYAPSQWQIMLQCNVISHWLGAYTEWTLLLLLWYGDNFVDVDPCCVYFRKHKIYLHLI